MCVFGFDCVGIEDILCLVVCVFDYGKIVLWCFIVYIGDICVEIGEKLLEMVLECDLKLLGEMI